MPPKHNRLRDQRIAIKNDIVSALFAIIHIITVSPAQFFNADITPVAQPTQISMVSTLTLCSGGPPIPLFVVRSSLLALHLRSSSAMPWVPTQAPTQSIAPLPSRWALSPRLTNQITHRRSRQFPFRLSHPG